MCHVHLIKQALKRVPKKKQKEMSEKVKDALVDRQRLQNLIRELDRIMQESVSNI